MGLTVFTETSDINNLAIKIRFRKAVIIFVIFVVVIANLISVNIRNENNLA